MNASGSRYQFNVDGVTSAEAFENSTDLPSFHRLLTPAHQGYPTPENRRSRLEITATKIALVGIGIRPGRVFSAMASHGTAGHRGIGQGSDLAGSSLGRSLRSRNLPGVGSGERQRLLLTNTVFVHWKRFPLGFSLDIADSPPLPNHDGASRFWATFAATRARSGFSSAFRLGARFCTQR